MSEKTKELVVQETKFELNTDINEAAIRNLIYVIRGQQVMMDSDLAELYQVETKALNRAVKRNISRFPDDFCFQLSEAEFENLRCQIGTSSLENDNYVDVGTLNILAKKKDKVIVHLYTVKKTKLSETDVNNFNQQYPVIEIHYTSEFHDRFLILDGTLAYHIGASIKDAGKKCFAINRIEDRANIIDILNRIKKTYNGGSEDGRE